MSLSRNGLDHGLLGSAAPILETDARVLADPRRLVAPSPILGLGIWAVFVRSRELRQRIRFAAQAHRLG